METTAVNPRVRKGPSTLLIVLLLVLLVGGGIGVFFMLKPKGNDQDQEKNPTDKKPSGASGRQVSNHHFQIPTTLLASITNGANAPTPTPGELGSSPDKPLYYKSARAKQLFADTAARMQLNESTMNVIRANYDIGKPLMATNSQQQECIDELFGKLLETDLTSDPNRRYLTYPVYGTFEPKGKEYRSELKNILDRGWEGLNLTDLRDSSAPWWCRKIGLNLLVGTTVPDTPTTHNTWASWAPRTELDFYKKLNRYWVDDKDLADVYINRHNTQQVVWKDHPDARSAYCATGMYELVERWVAEIDRLDDMTEWEAFEWLKKPNPDNNNKRWYFTFINPDTGKDETNSSDNPFALQLTNQGNKSNKLNG